MGGLVKAQQAVFIIMTHPNYVIMIHGYLIRWFIPLSLCMQNQQFSQFYREHWTHPEVNKYLEEIKRFQKVRN